MFKADMKSYIPLETAAIFFLANLFPKQGIHSEYVTADFICMGLLGLQGAKTENYKMKNSCPYRDSNSRPLILKSSALSMRLSSLIYINVNLNFFSRIQVCIVLFIATSYNARACLHFLVYLVL